jgi:hypothetical protein
MNLCCFLQSTLSLPGWRPFFRYFSWQTAVLGTLACAFIMFYIEGVISLVAVIVAVVLFIVIEITGDTTTFGSGPSVHSSSSLCRSVLVVMPSVSVTCLPFDRRHGRRLCLQASVVSSSTSRSRLYWV